MWSPWFTPWACSSNQSLSLLGRRRSQSPCGNTTIVLLEAAAKLVRGPHQRPSEKSLPLQDRVQADDLVKMLFSPEEVDLPQEQPLPGQQGSPEPGEESLSDRGSLHKDEL